MANLKEYVEKNIDYLKELELEQNIKHPNFNSLLTNNDDIFTTLYSEQLVKIVDDLKKCDEFSNVQKINFVLAPTFAADSQTDTPLNEVTLKMIFKPIQEIDENTGNVTVKLTTEVVKDSIPLGTKTISVETYQFGENTKFNHEIDIYNINFIKNYEKNPVLNKGIWKFPTVYDENSFEGTNQIKILFNERDMLDKAKHELKNEIFLQEDFNKAAKERVKKSIIEKLSAIFDNKPNIPFEYLIRIRCSPRSLKI